MNTITEKNYSDVKKDIEKLMEILTKKTNNIQDWLKRKIKVIYETEEQIVVNILREIDTVHKKTDVMLFGQLNLVHKKLCNKMALEYDSLLKHMTVKQWYERNHPGCILSFSHLKLLARHI